VASFLIFPTTHNTVTLAQDPRACPWIGKPWPSNLVHDVTCGCATPEPGGNRVAITATTRGARHRRTLPRRMSWREERAEPIHTQTQLVAFSCSASSGGCQQIPASWPEQARQRTRSRFCSGRSSTAPTPTRDRPARAGRSGSARLAWSQSWSSSWWLHIRSLIERCRKRGALLST
jgi:hypothetical protein